MLDWKRLSKEKPAVGERILIYFDGGHIEDALSADNGDGWYYQLFDGETLIAEPLFWAYFNEPG